MKKIVSSALAILMLLSLVSGVAAQATWKPNKPINIIVPWGAGGSTDQISRVTAGELEAVLGTKIVIVNQPGASGSVGTKSVLDAPRDGYTWAAGAAADLATYPVLGFLDTDIRKDWDIFLTVANVSVISVNAKTPYTTFDQLLAAFKANPGKVTVATAGMSSAGHIGIEMIKKFTGIEYKHVTYDGGNPAVIGTISGESQATTQLAVEQADMSRGKKLRPLAVLSDKPLSLDGYGTIAPITKWLKDFKAGSNYFGIFIPKGVPQEVVDTVSKAWESTIMKSKKIQEYAVARGAVFNPSFGQEAQNRAYSYYQPVAWLYFDAGKAKVSPDQLGIPRP